MARIQNEVNSYAVKNNKMRHQKRILQINIHVEQFLPYLQFVHSGLKLKQRPKTAC